LNFTNEGRLRDAVAGDLSEEATQLLLDIVFRYCDWSSFATATPNQGEGPPYSVGGANAALIVKAVNSYDEREALLAEAAEALRQITICTPGQYDEPATAANVAVGIARVMLAKIEKRL
jgi:hypothetical protein